MTTLPNYLAIVASRASVWDSTFIFQNDNETPMDITGRTFELVVRPDVNDTAPTPLIKVSSAGATAQGFMVIDLMNSSVLVVVSPTANSINAGGYFTLWMDPGLTTQTAMVQGPYNIAPTPVP